jgi:hypothetical protein
MRKSKYLNMESGEWTCTHVGVADVQPTRCRQKRLHGKLARSKHPGSQQYYYIFERLTSDAKAMKMIRLNAAQARAVLEGKYTVEDLAKKKAAKNAQAFKEKVSYSFCK